MIIDVKKHLILGAKEDLDRFFASAQQKGIIEFIPSQAKKTTDVPIEIQHLLDVMRLLRKLPIKKLCEAGGDLQYADETALKILELKTEIERLFEEKRLIEAEIVRVGPFGDFSLEEIDYIEKEGKLEIQFFCSKANKVNPSDIRAHKEITSLSESARQLQQIDDSRGFASGSDEKIIPSRELSDRVIFVGNAYDLDYFISINSQACQYPDMIEMRIDRPLAELQTHLSFVKESLHQMEAELKGYQGHIDFFQDALVERLNHFHLATAKKEVAFSLENTLFAVEIWVPKNKIHLLYTMIDTMAIHCEPILIEENDRVPTYIENTGISKMGEDLVRIYDTPAITDRDPSSWVFWFFALFFAIIIADAGYGLMYLCLCLYFKFKFPNLKGSSRRFLRLATILSSACIVWGFFTCAFFGIEVQPKSWLGRISPMQYIVAKKAEYHMQKRDDVYQFWVAKIPSLSTSATPRDFVSDGIVIVNGKTKFEVLDTFTRSILLEFSLMIGVIHISLSLLRYLRRHFAGIGWVAFMIGSYLYFPMVLKATSILHIFNIADKIVGAEIGLQLIYTGIIAALLLALLQKKLKGLGEIANLVQVFADVLSYLRLYALALAGSIMAATFNDMGQDVGLFFGALVVILGHTVNIMLGIMAGVIHGLRLNFIEWYHFCFDGGGRFFRPLHRLKSKEH